MTVHQNIEEIEILKGRMMSLKKELPKISNSKPVSSKRLELVLQFWIYLYIRGNIISEDVKKLEMISVNFPYHTVKSCDCL